MIPKIQKFVKEQKVDILLFIAILLVVMFSFSIGYIMAKMEEKEPLTFEQPVYENISL
jgi:lipopolysaccharide/colanic/teichoic acid biosynthesis glycosyltransferase